MKVVIDTNVLIDGIRDEYSYQKRIIDAVISGDIEAFANHKTLRENRLIMRQLIDNPEYEREIQSFYSQVNHVVTPGRLRVVRDSEDNKILESAVVAGCDYLITSDNDLLILENYAGVKIVTPQHFMAIYKDTGMDDWNALKNFWFGGNS